MEIWILGYCFWVVVPWEKFASTKWKHSPDLRSDASSVWDFCSHCSDVISWGTPFVVSWNAGCFLTLIYEWKGPFCVNNSPGFSFSNFSGCTEGIWQNDWWCRRWKGQNGMCIACLSWRAWKKTWISACPLGKQLSHFACPGTLLACLSSWFC